jgi:hypothetical protein
MPVAVILEGDDDEALIGTLALVAHPDVWVRLASTTLVSTKIATPHGRSSTTHCAPLQHAPEVVG